MFYSRWRVWGTQPLFALAQVANATASTASILGIGYGQIELTLGRQEGYTDSDELAIEAAFVDSGIERHERVPEQDSRHG